MIECPVCALGPDAPSHLISWEDCDAEMREKYGQANGCVHLADHHAYRIPWAYSLNALSQLVEDARYIGVLH